jgi:hypothetical protein
MGGGAVKCFRYEANSELKKEKEQEIEYFRLKILWP